MTSRPPQPTLTSPDSVGAFLPRPTASLASVSGAKGGRGCPAGTASDLLELEDIAGSGPDTRQTASP